MAPLPARAKNAGMKPLLKAALSLSLMVLLRDQPELMLAAVAPLAVAVGEAAAGLVAARR
jgi:hypothetical protein